jgi:hypothetical protein
MNLTFLRLTLGSFSGCAPFFIARPTSLLSFHYFTHARVLKSTQSFLFSSQPRFVISVTESLFRGFLSRPITIAAKDAYIKDTVTEHIFLVGERNFSMSECVCADCNLNEEHGGVVWVVSAYVTIDRCVFRNNSASFAGSFELQDAPYIAFNHTLVTQSRAIRFGGGQLDGHHQSDSAVVNGVNFTHDWAVKWIGALRIQHNGGPIQFCNFLTCQAETSGALWDYGHKPGYRVIAHVVFANNTAKTIGAGVTAYHLLFQGEICDSQFFGNRNVETGDGWSVYLQGDMGSWNLIRCQFRGSRDVELGQYFAQSNITADDSNQFNLIALN